MTWLITGGAGYIGAHTVREFRASGLPVVVLDDLSAGDPGRLPPDVPLVVAPVQDRAAVLRTLREFAVRGVVHLAARKSVPESIRRPGWYHAQNVGGLATVLDAMAGAGVRRIVYSSSAAVYGSPTGRVTEGSPTRPVNPYGHSKLLGEHLLRATAAGTRLSWVALRYFNVAGCADPRLADRIGGNLIPLALAAIRTGVPLTVTGLDHPTVDGTGVRDYVHVLDVAGAHLAAVQHLDTDTDTARHRHLRSRCGRWRRPRGRCVQRRRRPGLLGAPGAELPGPGRRSRGAAAARSASAG